MKSITFQTIAPHRVLLPPPLTRPLCVAIDNLYVKDLERYDSSTLFYDVWVIEDHLWMIGPPLLSLAALPLQIVCNEETLDVQREIVMTETEKVVIYRAQVALAPTYSVVIHFAQARIRLELPAITPRQGPPRRILTSLQKDNRIEWIADWIVWYAHHYAIDTVVLYDNASSAQASLVQLLSTALSSRLRACSLTEVIVVEWNAPYGLILNYNHGNFFAQHGSLNHCPRRFARVGDSLYNFDIDELLCCGADTLLAAPALLAFDSYWVPMSADLPSDYSFHHFTKRQRKPRGTCPKYILRWDGSALLCVHRVIGQQAHLMPPDEAYYLHYCGISTWWKDAVCRAGSARQEMQQRRALVNRWLLVDI